MMQRKEVRREEEGAGVIGRETEWK